MAGVAKRVCGVFILTMLAHCGNQSREAQSPEVLTVVLEDVPATPLSSEVDDDVESERRLSAEEAREVVRKFLIAMESCTSSCNESMRAYLSKRQFRNKGATAADYHVNNYGLDRHRILSARWDDKHQGVIVQATISGASGWCHRLGFLVVRENEKPVLRCSELDPLDKDYRYAHPWWTADENLGSHSDCPVR